MADRSAAQSSRTSSSSLRTTSATPSARPEATTFALPPLPVCRSSTVWRHLWLQRQQLAAVHQVHPRCQCFRRRSGHCRNDNACGNQTSGPQFLTVTPIPSATAASTNIPLGNYLVSAPQLLQLRRPHHQRRLQYQLQRQHPCSLHLQHPGFRGHRCSPADLLHDDSHSSSTSSLSRSTTPLRQTSPTSSVSVTTVTKTPTVRKLQLSRPRSVPQSPLLRSWAPSTSDPTPMHPNSPSRTSIR